MKKTVRDIMELIDDKAYVVLEHKEEDDMRGIYRTIIEKGQRNCIVETYGLHKMESWIIESITTYTECADAFIKIEYRS